VVTDFNKKLSAVFTQLARAGQALREAGLTEDAIKCFEALSTGDETFESGSYAFDLAICYEQLGEINKAKEYIAIAMRENPSIYSDAEETQRILSK
jgi:tetratricopeptide (TPR) repeat protein